MSETPFYKTRMGQQFYDRTMPALVEAVGRLADGDDGKRDPRIQELIEHAGYLVEGVEQMMNTPIEPGSATTREAFDLLRSQAAAVRRILAKTAQA